MGKPPVPTSRRLEGIQDPDDFERAVKRRLPRAVDGYVVHGSETETSLRSNRAVFDCWRPRRSGSRLWDGSALVAFNGHKVMAKAAAKAQIPFILSANSTNPLEEIARVNPNAQFAPYQSPTPQAIEGMVDRVARAGISVLALTTDVPVGSNREADARAGFGFPIRPNLRLSWDVATHPSGLPVSLGGRCCRVASRISCSLPE